MGTFLERFLEQFRDENYDEICDVFPNAFFLNMSYRNFPACLLGRFNPYMLRMVVLASW